MNNLEDRIYRDAMRTAAQVTDADIPPLRLAAGTQTMRWSGAGRGAASRRILVPLAAAASVAGLISVLIVVGHGSPGPHRPVRPSVAPAKRTASDRALITEALDWYFPASGRTYTSGQDFAWAEQKIIVEDISPCLAQAGFPQPRYRNGVRDFEIAFPDNSEFPNLAQLAIHPDQGYLLPWPVLKHPTSARLKAFGIAQHRCTARYATRVTRIDKAAEALQSAWNNIITAIEHSPAMIATQPPFARCLEIHGVPASLATQTDNSADNPLFYGYFAWADGLNQAAKGGKQYAADLRHEVKVFIACARPAVSVLERIQLTRRAQFFHEHALQIARIMHLVKEMPRLS